ncbi:MAG: hypothetical protein V3V61_05415 [Gammaproteobacteria bacterium]
MQKIFSSGDRDQVSDLTFDAETGDYSFNSDGKHYSFVVSDSGVPYPEVEDPAVFTISKQD